MQETKPAASMSIDASRKIFLHSADPTPPAIVSLMVLICLLLVSPPAGQEIGKDSTGLAANYHAGVLYQIKWTRVQRLVTSCSSQEKPLPADLQQTLLEAQGWADQSNYELAIPFIDQVLLFLEETAPLSEPVRQKTASVTTQIMSGFDLWQQRFSITISDQDSVIFEDEGNPYIGIRLTWAADGALQMKSRACLEAKHSHEYASGYSEWFRQFELNRRISLFLDHRLEGLYYYREQNFRYGHDRAHASLACKMGRSTLALDEEWQWRKYVKENDLFASFWQNQSALRWWCELPVLSRTELRYDWRLRQYPIQSRQNYLENALSLIIWPDVQKRLQFSTFSQYKERRYSFSFIDSLLTNPYHDFYHESSLKIRTVKNLFLLMETSFDSRAFNYFSEAMPNYRDYALEAGFSCTISTFGTVKTGYRFRRREHSFAPGLNQQTAKLEDFYAHAPVVQLDMVYGRLLFNISEIFEMRRYPHAPESALSIYANRNVNTLLLLLSWAPSSRWEINVLGNIDDDQARNPQEADSRSNILNFELLFKY
jgi:hypothetical protein